MVRDIDDNRIFKPSTLNPQTFKPPTFKPSTLKPSNWLARAAVLALCVGGAWGASGVAQASAQEAKSSWEQGCAFREVQPGSGDALRQYNCTRQKECQQMANAKGAMTMEVGCFFVEPSATAPAPAAGRTRPAQQQ